jgi:hypothetical protein
MATDEIIFRRGHRTAAFWMRRGHVSPSLLPNQIRDVQLRTPSTQLIHQMKFFTTVIDQLKQKSTWAGLATLAAVAGLHLSGEQWGAISTAVIGAIGVFEVFRKEKV